MYIDQEHADLGVVEAVCDPSFKRHPAVVRREKPEVVHIVGDGVIGWMVAGQKFELVDLAEQAPVVRVDEVRHGAAGKRFGVEPEEAADTF